MDDFPLMMAANAAMAARQSWKSAQEVILSWKLEAPHRLPRSGDDSFSFAITADHHLLVEGAAGLLPVEAGELKGRSATTLPRVLSGDSNSFGARRDSQRFLATKWHARGSIPSN